MKKAEVIKLGNVNLKPIKTRFDEDGNCFVEFKKKDIDRIKKKLLKSTQGKTRINWDMVFIDFREWYYSVEASSRDITNWFKKRIEKELNSSPE